MGYLDAYLNGQGIRLTVDRCKDLLDEKEVDFNAIAVRGVSGILIGAPLASATKTDLIVIRKDDERCHSDSKAEGWGFNQKILIVDDFIETGDTVDQIYETITETCDSYSIAGILLYAGNLRAFKKKTYKHPDGTKFKVWHLKK